MSIQPDLPSFEGSQGRRSRPATPSGEGGGGGDRPSGGAGRDGPAGDVVAQLAEAQRQLDALRDQLNDSHRLATIGTIAAVIAHEFNNILTPVVSYAQFALRSAESETPDLDLIRKALSKAFVGSNKAGRICNSMLGLARGQSSPERVEVRQLVDEALMVLARDPQKDGIALRVQVPPGLAVRGDPLQLEQVLLNLLINARHAMLGRGGSLTVKAGETAGGEVGIQVVDTGPGIPAEVIGHIFEPFFTTKMSTAATQGRVPPKPDAASLAAEPGSPQAKGSGLGLAVCKEIVELHGGRIEVRSRLGRGTTFEVVLPIAEAEVVEPRRAA